LESDVDIEPLHAPEILSIDSSASPAEGRWRLIPIFGWAMAASMWSARTRTVVIKIAEQLEARQKPAASIWGDNADKTALAQYVCLAVRNGIGWPNDYFIPSDPAYVVFWSYRDGLGLDELILEIEEHLEIDEPALKFNLAPDQTLGDIVDMLWDKHNSSSTARA
jgi:hypothetical protein